MDTEIIVWQLGRIYSAACKFREQDPSPAEPVAWWEPGSIWSAEKPSLAMDFAAFQIGVTVREIGGLEMLAAVLRDFAEKSGDTANRWLTQIWAEHQHIVEGSE